MMSSKKRVVKLEEVCANITDGKHGDCQGEDGSGFYFLSCKDIFDGKLNYQTARQITEVDFVDTHRRTRLEPLDILITNSGTIGRMAVVPDNDFTRRTTFQKSVAILKPIKTRVVPRFLYYLLGANVQRLTEFAGGTAQKNLLLRDLRAFHIELPEIESQHRIASILSTYDDLIENNTRRIAILEEMARRLYEEWFVRFRFPGHEQARMVESELGLIPEGWEVATVDDTVDLLGGGTPSKVVPEYWEGGTINWYSPTDLTRAGSVFMDCSGERITALGLAKSSARLFPPYSVMMTSRATLGVIAVNTTEACTNQGFITCLPNAKFPIWMLYQWLKANVETFISLGTGATFKEITKGVFRTIKLAVPPEQISTNYQTLAEPMMGLVLRLQRKNTNLRAQRDLLLPKLISGEIDVSAFPEPEALAA